MTQPLSDAALDTLFREARTHNGWVDETLPPQAFHDIYDLMKWGPTSANISPARFVWVASAEAKEKLAALSMPANGEKIKKAPVTVIIGDDLDFPELIPKLFPHNPAAKDWFGDPVLRDRVAFRNGSLQGAYLMIAARALGYQCGPMSGFRQRRRWTRPSSPEPTSAPISSASSVTARMKTCSPARRA